MSFLGKFMSSSGKIKQGAPKGKIFSNLFKWWIRAVLLLFLLQIFTFRIDSCACVIYCHELPRFSGMILDWAYLSHDLAQTGQDWRTLAKFVQMPRSKTPPIAKSFFASKQELSSNSDVIEPQFSTVKSIGPRKNLGLPILKYPQYEISNPKGWVGGVGQQVLIAHLPESRREPTLGVLRVDRGDTCIGRRW